VSPFDEAFAEAISPDEVDEMQHMFKEIIRVDPKSQMSSAAADVLAARHGMDTLRMAMSKAFQELCICWWKSDDLHP
jgi:hypothetical protein